MRGFRYANLVGEDSHVERLMEIARKSLDQGRGQAAARAIVAAARYCAEHRMAIPDELFRLNAELIQQDMGRLDAAST